MKLASVLLTESTYAPDELKGAASELFSLSQKYGKAKMPGGAVLHKDAKDPRTNTPVLTQANVELYFQKFATNPDITSIVVDVVDNLPQVFLKTPPAPEMSSDDRMRQYIDQERKAGRSID